MTRNSHLHVYVYHVHLAAEEKTTSRYQEYASQCLSSRKESSQRRWVKPSHSLTMPRLTSGIAHDLPSITRLPTFHQSPGYLPTYPPPPVASPSQKQCHNPQYCTLQPRRDHPVCMPDVLLSRPFPTCSANLRAWRWDYHRTKNLSTDIERYSKQASNATLSPMLECPLYAIKRL